MGIITVQYQLLHCTSLCIRRLIHLGTSHVSLQSDMNCILAETWMPLFRFVSIVQPIAQTPYLTCRETTIHVSSSRRRQH